MTQTRLHALTVGRNEADRYLASMLERAASVVDTHFFYDDGSTDDTPLIAAEFCTVVGRHPSRVSFLEHEGQFRQNAWDIFNDTIQPGDGDWVLAIDCDELLVAEGGGDLRARLHGAISRASTQRANAIIMPVPECFGYDVDGTPLIRTDGLWGSIRGTRLFRWQPGGVFRDRPMGCGSEPTYATKPPHSEDSGGVAIMHLGYAAAADVAAKFERYSAMEHGHNDRHIQSIPQSPVVKRWAGEWEPVAREKISAES